MEEEKIKQIRIDSGWIYATEESPINCFTVNGEMAYVFWYRQGKKEYNGKYVIELEYY